MAYVDVNGLPTWHEVMADDTVAYLDGVVRGPAKLVGWSDGAVVALLVVYAKTLRMPATEPELATTLPQGRLAVLPGPHALPMENPEVVNALLLWFLAGAVPAIDWTTTGR